MIAIKIHTENNGCSAFLQIRYAPSTWSRKSVISIDINWWWNWLILVMWQLSKKIHYITWNHFHLNFPRPGYRWEQTHNNDPFHLATEEIWDPKVTCQMLINKGQYHRASKGHQHDDVIKWKHFPRYWPFVRGIHWSPVNSPHKAQWRGALMFSLICVWINGWVHNREAGDLRRHRARYDVTVMICILRRDRHLTVLIQWLLFQYRYQ